MVKQVLAIALVTVCLTACNDTKKVQETQDENVGAVTDAGTNDSQLVGHWVEPIPINTQEVQGIEMMADGTAKSINMATLLYSKWWTKDHQLFLIEESQGSGGAFIDTAAYEIVKVDQDSLVLKNNDRTLRYKKQ